jgi:hypothetical protein
MQQQTKCLPSAEGGKIMIRRPFALFALSIFVLSTIAQPQHGLSTTSPTGQTVIDGVKIWNRGGISLGHTPADLLALLPDAQEIPGYTVVAREYRGQEDPGTFAWAAPFGHTWIVLNQGKTTMWSNTHDTLHCKRERIWFPLERAQAYLSREIPTYADLTRSGKIHAQIAVYIQPIQETFESVQRQSSAILQRGTPSGKPLGDEAWYIRTPQGGGNLCFLYDKAQVDVSAENLATAEAVAQCILYRLIVHPKRVVTQPPLPSVLVEGKPFTPRGIASLNGVVVVPVSALAPFGVTAETLRTPELWTITLRRGSLWFRLQAFRWEADSSVGRVKLLRAAFPYDGDLVVPLRQVAEALGLTVQAQ